MNAVDLGLSVLWADMNIGALQCSDIGDYFAWGQITPSTMFNESNYIEPSLLTEKYGNIQKLTQENDAAVCILGNRWRMPTRYEAMELIEKRNVEILQINGVFGSKISANNGNYIFLPNTGRIVGKELLDARRLYYWVATSIKDADGLGGDRGDLRWYHSYRKHVGRCIRPVLDF